MTEILLVARILVLTVLASVFPKLYAQIWFRSKLSCLRGQWLECVEKAHPHKQVESDTVVKHATLLAKDLIAQVIEKHKTAPHEFHFCVEFDTRTNPSIMATCLGILKNSGWHPTVYSDGKVLIEPSRREDVGKLRSTSADLAYQFADGSAPYVASPHELGIAYL